MSGLFNSSNVGSGSSSSSSNSGVDDKGCPIVPAGFTIRLVSWASLPAYVASGVFVILLLVFAANLIRAYSNKDRFRPRARTAFTLLTSFALFRALGFILRAVSATMDNGPGLALYITVLVFQSMGFLPLLQLLLDATSEWLNHVQGGPSGGLFGKIQRYLRIIVVITVTVAITGAVWVAQAAPCLPSPTAVNIRNASLWMIAALTWVSVLFALRLGGSGGPGGLVALLVIQGLLLTVRTSYNLVYYLRTDMFRDEPSFYLLSILPEVLFALPFLAGATYVSDTYMPGADGQGQAGFSKDPMMGQNGQYGQQQGYQYY
ncbi:hypothetical protein HK101_001903 [Irineochytrium annulatum]|nr:hypothetical protein HK101_001903 [Irineochytrium annulatum]